MLADLQAPGSLKIDLAGLVPLTTIDFPDHLAAVIFCQGCPLRCYYCHNPQLQKRRGELNISWEQIIKFLFTRIGLLEAVVFSGGEPTLQPNLLGAIKAVKALGFKVGIHTAGIYPKRLAKVLPYLDWVGMDLKAPFAEYASITRVSQSGKLALQSVQLILASKVPHEFRTTVHPKLLDPEQLLKIQEELFGLVGGDLNRINYKLQQFRAEGCVEAWLTDYVR